MKRLTQIFPLMLAAALQILPLLRNLVATPTAGSSFAIILRWGVGLGASIGAVDAVSGATSVFTTPSTINGTVGSSMSNNVTVSIGGGNTAAKNDYIIVSYGGVSSSLLLNSNSTTTTLPPGLTFTASWKNGASTIGGYLSGTPTTAGTNKTTVTIVSPGNASLSQTITINITGSSGSTAPTITTPPANSTVIAGQTATFTAAAGGSAPISYQWLKNGTPITTGGNFSGTATTTLTIANVSAADAGNYSMTASNSVGSITSATAALTVLVPPSLSGQPAAQSVATGSNATFSVNATGSPTLGYFWQKNGAAIANGTKYSGVNSTALTVATVAAGDAGNYSVIVTNSAGSITSSVAPLTVLSLPSITTPPANLSVISGANAAFSVTATGSAPLTYLWLKNGAPLSNAGNVSGATTANLNLTSVTSGDAGNYSVAVSNSLGGVISSAATLTISVPPTITTSPASVTIAASSNVTFNVTATGSPTLTYTWLKNGNALLNGGNISGATTSALTLTGVTATDAATYSVIVSNSVGHATSGNATLTVISPPAITTPPGSVNAIAGTNASFSVTAAGSAPLYYFWQKNGSPLANGGNISGATTATLNLSGVSNSDAATYSVIVSNSLGTITSSGATLAVFTVSTIVTPPTAATIAAGSNTTFTVSASGSAPLAYQWLKNGVGIAGATSSSLAINNATLADAGTYSVQVTNAVGSALSAGAVLTVLSPASITGQPVSLSVNNGSNATFTVTATGTAPLAFQWQKNGSAIPGATSNVLTLANVSTNDVGTYSVVVSNQINRVVSADATLTVLAVPVILNPPASATVVAGNSVTFTVTAGGNGPFTYQWCKNGGAISGANATSFTINAVSAGDAGNYCVVVSNTVGSVTSANAALVVQMPPALLTQPTDQTGVLGNPVTLSATASGTGPLSWQWFANGLPLADGGNFSGTTTSSLTIASLTTNDLASYYVVVDNSLGSVTSNPAMISLSAASDAPVITVQPQSQQVSKGTNVILTVNVTGSGPLTYHWRCNGVNLQDAGKFSGTKTATLQIANALPLNNGNYSVVVVNSFGKVISSNATLSVFAPPHFTLQAPNRAVKQAANTTFTTAAGGTGPLSWQWFKDGNPLADGPNVIGSATPVLKVKSLTETDAGGYYAVVSNLVGNATSKTSTLTVLTPPSISTQPASQITAANDSTTFTVEAKGTGTLHYQWRKAGVNILGATGPSYTIAKTKPVHAGIYTVLVQNAAGAVVSSKATLTVMNPPAFASQAKSQTVTYGSTTTFACQAKGTGPLNYQWFKDGNPITDNTHFSGTQSNVLTVANVTRSYAGNYFLRVTNFAGSVDSTNAGLTVQGYQSGDAIIQDLSGSPALKQTAATPELAIAQILPVGDGTLTLFCQGTPGTNYLLQITPDLQNWSNIATNTADVNGHWQVIDTMDWPVKFYRIQEIQ